MKQKTAYGGIFLRYTRVVAKKGYTTLYTTYFEVHKNIAASKKIKKTTR